MNDVIAGSLGGFRAPGAVAVVARHGASNEEVGVGAEPGQLFEIGSITKTMTALLVLQHVQYGRIELDDPITAYLPDLRVLIRGATERVTIRHLLTHTSGIDCGDDFSDTGNGDDCLERYVGEILPEVGLLHEPGEYWSYSNGGYSLLGRLVEVLDGRPFDDALIDRVFRPLGLAATTTARLESGQRITQGNRFDPTVGALVPESGRMPRSAGPAGNVVATGRDLAKFCEDLFSGQSDLLKLGLVKEMTRPQVAIRDGGQALAWVVPASDVVVHGGATRGSTAFLAAIPGLGSISVVANGPGAGAISGEIRAHLFGPQPDPSQPREPVPMSSRRPALGATSGDTPASTSHSKATSQWPPRGCPVRRLSYSRTQSRSLCHP